VSTGRLLLGATPLGHPGDASNRLLDALPALLATPPAQDWEAAASGWRVALESQAWDGAWYRRAFFDDGSALGAQANGEARIDLIAQAWAVLAGVAPVQVRRLTADEIRGMQSSAERARELLSP
jgi:hypothetical protein